MEIREYNINETKEIRKCLESKELLNKPLMNGISFNQKLNLTNVMNMYDLSRDYGVAITFIQTQVGEKSKIIGKDLTKFENLITSN